MLTARATAKGRILPNGSHHSRRSNPPLVRRRSEEVPLRLCLTIEAEPERL